MAQKTALRTVVCEAFFLCHILRGQIYYEAESENYPGSVKSIGLALAYQRFLWKDFYTAVHAASLKIYI
jgi:hypothetical protein